MINFNVPPFTGKELDYIREAVERQKICGDGIFTKKCNEWLEQKTGTTKCLLTTSCTHAIELAALLCEIKPGDEVIMPSFTFVSTADAFVLRGATIVFIDIRPDTMNMDENLIEEAITDKTKAIVPVHYAGVACEMDKIMEIANKYNLFVVEDAAQGIMSTYKGKPLGTFGEFGCLSFHETKNYSMGEGGAILIRDEQYIEPAEIIREKGTDRSKFFRGQVDKYTWVNFGSSYLPSDMNAAYLYAQLELAEEINQSRITIWNRYYKNLNKLAEKGQIELPVVPDGCVHNGHMFYMKAKDISELCFDHYHHVGIYAYKAKTVLKYAKMPQTSLEKCESLEQLRLMQNGMSIAVGVTLNPPETGVDTPEDLERINAILSKE